METRAVEVARRWPADRGVRQVRGGWVSAAEPEVLLTAGQVAHSWAGEVFAEVLGNDIDRVVAERSEALLRRARRVLECSGPARWAVKEPTYRAAVRLPALHPAVFRGLRASFHDVYGDLDATAALTLLDRLNLPTNTGDGQHEFRRTWLQMTADTPGQVPFLRVDLQKLRPTADLLR
ncbi:hypothetical protein [Streptomyces sp. NPDC059575]|uniref:hypothetical protein n=1 Tax=Streptomyces sp. NPDC059575 TaxID=3346872 RepID=UPI003689FCBB